MRDIRNADPIPSVNPCNLWLYGKCVKRVVCSCLSRLILLLGSCHALNAAMVYCTNPGGYIELGMSMAEIKAKCGTPFDVQKSRAFVTRRIAVQQYFYQISRNPGTRLNMNLYNGGTGNSTTLVVTVRAHKIAAISVGGVSSHGASLCKGGTIAVGDGAASLTSNCGKPNYINQSFIEVSEPNAKPAEVETWLIEQNQSYGENLTLTFNNGLLKAIK